MRRFPREMVWAGGWRCPVDVARSGVGTSRQHSLGRLWGLWVGTTLGPRVGWMHRDPEGKELHAQCMCRQLALRGERLLIERTGREGPGHDSTGRHRPPGELGRMRTHEIELYRSRFRYVVRGAPSHQAQPSWCRPPLERGRTSVPSDTHAAPSAYLGAGILPRAAALAPRLCASGCPPKCVRHFATATTSVTITISAASVRGRRRLLGSADDGLHQ